LAKRRKENSKDVSVENNYLSSADSSKGGCKFVDVLRGGLGLNSTSNTEGGFRMAGFSPIPHLIKTRQAQETMKDCNTFDETDNEYKSYQLEKDALEIINTRLNKKYRSLKEINLVEVLRVPSKHNNILSKEEHL